MKLYIFYDTIYNTKTYYGSECLSTIKKLYNKFKQRPIRNDIEFDEVIKLLTHFGFEVKDGSNHICFTYIELGILIPIPRHNKSIDDVYIKQIIQTLDEVLEYKEEII